MFKYFKFKINDTVQFVKNDGHFYRVIGYRIEKSIYLNDEYSSIIYELLREFDGLQVDAEEDELVSVSNFDEFYGSMFEKLGTFTIKFAKKQEDLKKSNMVEASSVDELLDKYNDYRRLAILFKDCLYDLAAENVLNELTDFSESKKDYMH
ncbi:histidinol dehydrogenase [Gottfriedia acidiceleris]|uniref:Histidinol dehydrogenase n=1 Tax=Gottfriedia acidiceleris TaxID=371036 RepID=A0ABY4JHG8_9BACI|nr:histidinol dehydrogenase [Gottfriedia acidiceleris]UPM53281.1 histidinol dehydrogenase [Gottfriedia acidiceleris]